MFVTKLRFEEPIHSVECCEINKNNYENENNIEIYDMIAYGCETQLGILRNEFSNKKISYEVHHKYLCGSKTTSISWSNESYLYKKNNEFKSNILIATANSDKNIRVYNNDNIEIISGHRDFINDIAFGYDKSERILASVSDDRTCRVWKISKDLNKKQSEEYYRIILKSSGKSVRFHKQNIQLLMVAERNGSIRIVNWNTSEFLFTFYESGLEDIGSLNTIESAIGLRSADWNPYNLHIIGSVIGQKFYIWNTSEAPIHKYVYSGNVHKDGSKCIKFSAHDGNYFATLSSSSKRAIYVHKLTKKVPITLDIPENLPLAQIESICWHLSKPILIGCIGNQLLFWDISV